MTTLSIDIETYSGTDLKTSGVYKYTEDTEFEILLLAYAFDGGLVRVLDLIKEEIPQAILDAMSNPEINKTAWNAAFEITCLSKYFDIDIDPAQWECTMVKAAYAGLPLGLSQCAKAIGQEEQKMTSGKALIKYFCEPCKPTKVNGGRTRNLPHHAPEKWEEFKAYCAQDVVTEMSIGSKLGFVKYTESERKLWALDQQINKRGVGCDMQLVENAIAMDDVNRERLTIEAKEITGLANPNSPIQLCGWLSKQLGYTIDSLNKESVEYLLKRTDISEVISNRAALEKQNAVNRAKLEELSTVESREEVAHANNWVCVFTQDNWFHMNAEGGFEGSDMGGRSLDSVMSELFPIYNLGNVPSKASLLRALKIRQEMGKTSVKKYAAIKSAVCSDGRVRGLLQLYGANRTGRWASRLLQVHNLPRNYLKDLDLARQLVLNNDLDSLTAMFGELPMVLSELIRTSFVAKEGHTFAVADFSAIEARVIAWLAGEEWVLEVFRTHGKIYEASAAQMFHVPLDEVTKDLRSRGKVATLALGFQGGVGALSRMDVSNSIPEEEKQGLVDSWRASNPDIVKLWHAAQKAALKAVKDSCTVTINKGIKFIGGRNMLFVELPSGRRLSYVKPRIIQGQYGDALQYWGTNQETKQWGLVDTYGGKIVENLCQSVARDCLAASMLALDKAGYEICVHVHDEVIIETPIAGSKEELEKICSIMGQEIEWAKGLPLNAEGYVTNYYKKE